MFQSFNASTQPENGPPRLARLREELARRDLTGFLVPRADAHQGEYVAKRDERLAWLTGFTGSAGFGAILPEIAGVFVDGRYRVQVKSQIASEFTPVHWPETQLENWLIEQLPEGGVVGFDPWLHTSKEIARLRAAFASTDITLTPIDNAVDAIWDDQPPRPSAPATAYPAKLAGKTSGEKRAEIAKILTASGQKAAVLTLPDSINWLLNIRGGDLLHLPVVQCFAVIDNDGLVTLFSDISKFAPLGPDPSITIKEWGAFDAHLAALSGPVRVDPATAPHQVSLILREAGIEIQAADDPCILPKACKTLAEIAATRAAHIRDGAAMVRFMHWFDQNADAGTVTEIDCAKALEGFRADTGVLKDIAFDTISGAGPNGAIVHYRVTEETNATLQPGQLYLVDSGGQYEDGTTDITRVMPIGTVGAEERTAFTQVLKGMIAVSRLVFPKGISGAHIDALARAPLWMAGRDYDHGTGHGVGVYLSVHEGPQRISRVSDVPLEPGMILSNEPGYYREGAFGIRIENLIVVQDAAEIEGGDARAMLSFETLTYAPIDRRLIDASLLNAGEIEWLNAYHAATAEKLLPALEESAAHWLRQATAPL